MKLIGVCLGIISLIFITIFSVSYYNQQQLISYNLSKNIKIFQIGPQKCGTTSLADFFNANGVPSIHNDHGKLAQTIMNNHNSGKPLLAGPYAPFIGYFDMMKLNDDINQGIIIATLFFKDLDRQYPGSKFILNVRDKNKWLRSVGYITLDNGLNLVEHCAKANNLSTSEILSHWSAGYDAHYAAVLEYFKDRPNDLLVFNIESDPPEKLSIFFKDYFKLDPKLYGHKNKTKQN